MRNDLDEQIDNILERIARDASLNEAQIDQLAASPEMWWGTQRKIGRQTEAISPWPPPPKFWLRALKFAVPTFAVALLVGLGILWNISPEQRTGHELGAWHVDQPHSEQSRVTLAPEPVGPGSTTISEVRSPGLQTSQGPTTKRTVERKKVADVRREEFKSEFVALTNGLQPEGGHVVRVRVPRSMMVTVGLVSAVESPTALIDADVVVGDDGRTHAIRFITQ